jgi:glycosyltransferase involved in cell wall biosynthesis
MARLGGFDVLHAYWGIPAGIVGTRVAGRLGSPAVVTFDSGEFVALPDIGYGLQRRWIDRRAIAATSRAATRITVCTDYMARLAAAHDVAVERVPLGVDPGRFPRGEPANGPPWRLLHVASLNPVKDHTTLLHAMARVVARLPHVHLDIVGEDTLGGRVQRLCREMALDPHVTFHGFQPTDALASFYQRAHLHVVSSRHEAAGAVTLEAACAGVATIGTAVGYVADWAGDRAVAVPVRDPDALATAVLAMLEDPGRRMQLASAARSWALEHSAAWTADRFEQIYNEVTERRARRVASVSR